MYILPEQPTPDDLRKLADAMEDSGRHQWPGSDVPERALHWLEYLTERGGLPGKRDFRSQNGSLRTSNAEDPWNTPHSDKVSAVKLKNGDTIFLAEDSKRTGGGYRPIRVAGRPFRIEKAQLALLFTMEGRSVSPELVSETLAKCDDLWFVDSSDPPVREDLEEAEFLIAHTVDMLRYFRPGFDDLPRTEQQALVQGACTRTSEFLEALRKLISFLEYGAGGRDTRASVENAARDIEVATLREVDGLTYREIAERMNVQISQSAQAVGDYSTIKKMVDRGRKILTEGWGEACWRRKVAAMKDEAKSWRLRDVKQQVAEQVAETLDTTPERAHRLLSGRDEPSRGAIEDLVIGVFKNFYDRPPGIQ